MLCSVLLPYYTQGGEGGWGVAALCGWGLAQTPLLLFLYAPDRIYDSRGNISYFNLQEKWKKKKKSNAQYF